MPATLLRRFGWTLGLVLLGIAMAWAAPPPSSLYQPGGSPPVASQPADHEEPAVEQSAGGLRKLTPQEINRLRFLELKALRENKLADQPDRVSCKVPHAVVSDFLVEMEGREDFITAITGSKDAGWERARQAFNKLTAPQKLHQIAYYKGPQYADRVEITSDPEVFIEFKRNVLPVVMRSCATSSCHGLSAREGPRFVLFNDPKKSPSTFYANFLVLSEVEVEGRPLIDRANPENSLLLTYMLPASDVKPELRHTDAAKIKPVFQARTARGYQRILSWIKSLKHPAEDYGVHLLTPPAPVEHEPLPDPKPQSESRPPVAPEASKSASWPH